jgi:hypothetical protein
LGIVGTIAPPLIIAKPPKKIAAIGKDRLYGIANWRFNIYQKNSIT